MVIRVAKNRFFGREGVNAYVCTPNFEAQMAELVDASDSKSGIGNNVQVRFLFWAQNRTSQKFLWFVLFSFYRK